mmetsp:Transcript_22082/g.47399  ORF Transcript_22082/g.47399 Transcript_22082/m.47399 type:complete len:360 (+) Transcript_22082:167-1246(+)|eukprot:CAMPEP_0172530384 /NCGR_PEP_ID=MMETSP1067-20121228/4132_1 /TAXON_ID=265564 ORGANISM="Thalassiosira punctigera, Strain Tpunct2005C2" /NCGR_SAMPLE_ID=MMETSP1067 /ASSEMBLY_ACC=CAM_ASM_000444 /LENGTH=359 /DNA_ID=CAMNT_0013314577 /DNA_START=127 /DNA_END=1206 /DNA_ORIENTATION=+
MASSFRYHQRNNHQRIAFLLISKTCLLLIGRVQNSAALVLDRSSQWHHRRTNNCGGLFVPSRQTNNRNQFASPTAAIIAFARNRNDEYDDDGDDWDDYFDDDDDGDYYERPRLGRRSDRRRRPPIDDLGTPPLTGSSPDDTSLSVPSPFGRGDSGLRLPPSVSASLLAGVFVLGIGTGVTVDSQINTNPKDLASRDAVDKNAPNPTLCTTYGASAMAFDQRVFVSFNPFNVYVAQADVKPACVLRPSNVVPVLRDQRKLVNDNEIRSCKMNMNTWAFVGDLNDQPQLSCVYKSEDAQNEFLEDPKRGIGEDYLDDDRDKATGKKTGKMVKDNLTEAQKKMVLDAGEKYAGVSGGGLGMF